MPAALDAEPSPLLLASPRPMGADRDALSLWTAVEALWPTMIALGIAFVGPVVILFQD